MLTLLPVFMLLLSAIVIQLVGRISHRPGSTWWLATVLGAIAWLLMIALGFLKPAEVQFQNWLPSASLNTQVVLGINKDNWVFGFLLLTTIEVMILYNARYLDSAKYLNKLSGLMVIGAFGLIAILSRSPLAFIIAWTLIDLAEFGVLTAVIGETENYQTKIYSVFVRTGGIIFLVMAISRSAASIVFMEGTSPLLRWLLLLTVVSRMGILPINPPISRDVSLQRDLVTVLRLIPLLTAFSFITVIPAAALPDNLRDILVLIFTIGALFGAVSWIFSTDELAARPYWFFSLGCLGIISYLTGTAESLEGLAVLAAVAGTGVFLYHPRFRKIYPFIPVLLVGMFGFPFTPTNAVMQLFVQQVLLLNQIFWSLSLGLLIAGVVKHATVNTLTSAVEVPWVRLMHTIGMYFLALSPWMIVAVFFTSHNYVQKWWVSLLILGLTACLGLVAVMVKSRNWGSDQRFSKIHRIASKLLKFFDSLLRFRWLGRIFAFLGKLLERFVFLIVSVLEGDGGILWSFLFLVLLFSLLFTG